MTVIYFVRHGQTDWNKLGLFRGRADRGLDDVGLRQGQLVSQGLEGSKGIKKLYSSPMRRCLETFSNLSAKMRHKPIFSIPGLIDIDYGDWQGLGKQEVAQKWPELWEKWHSDPFGVEFPNGESLKAVQERGLKAVKDIIQDANGATVAVCTHRVMLKALFCGFVQASSPQAFYTFKLDPASISIVRYNGDLPIIESINDTRHVRGDNPLEGPADF